MATKFLRRTGDRYSKLGKGRKKKQVWRKPTGRDNKMRERRKGYPKVVSLGYKKNSKLRGEIEEKKVVIVKNIKDLNKVKKHNVIKIGHIGMKKKIEILKIMKEKKLEAINLDVNKFLKKMEKKNKSKIQFKNNKSNKKEKK